MILKAETIWAGRGRLIKSGGILIEGDSIEAVGAFNELPATGQRVLDLRDAVLLPAFINAHSHLDLSHLKDRMDKGDRFSDWLMNVARSRSYFESRSVRRGIGEMIGGGTMAVGDASQTGRSATLLYRRGMTESITFIEAQGIDPARADMQAGEVRGKIEHMHSHTPARLGISPHATYSVSPKLFLNCLSLAGEYGLPLAIHVAETNDEVEMLTHGTGQLRNTLKAAKLLPADWRPPGTTPVRFLRDLGILEAQPMLIHCNHIDDEEAAIIAEHGCSVAYCPRSNAWFRRATDSLQRMLAAGVNVTLGTGSLASNDTLSMLDELRFLNQRHHGMDPESIMEMATHNAAKALGIRQSGRLEIGLRADIVAISPGQGDDVFARILDSGSSVLFTMAAGQRLRPRSFIRESAEA